eukprot:TRINITY_DN552_c0_g1_i1.p3 TRINITY_DN552_c0_g1~~TRINITY_DN552_c0_g1_i1.p3  ORF type:complete len:98 (+),score=49.18 TRINITY_DN552_c0_g1_i1:199-492(+)
MSTDKKEQKEFNYAQRVHGNYVEGFTLYILFLIITGLSFPVYAAVAGAIYIVGRQVYSIGYMIHPQKRMYGAIIFDLALLALLGGAIYSAYLLSPLA